MYTESIPLYVFIRNAFDSKEIKTISDQWRVEVNQLVSIIHNQISELGVYEVPPELARYMKTVILEYLVNSPEILKIVNEAERRERILARTKKSLSD